MSGRTRGLPDPILVNSHLGLSKNVNASFLSTKNLMSFWLTASTRSLQFSNLQPALWRNSRCITAPAGLRDFKISSSINSSVMVPGFLASLKKMALVELMRLTTALRCWLSSPRSLWNSMSLLAATPSCLFNKYLVLTASTSSSNDLKLEKELFEFWITSR